jgi:hypothetical protein
MGENLEVVRSKFSTLRQAVFVINAIEQQQHALKMLTIEPHILDINAGKQLS